MTMDTALPPFQTYAEYLEAHERLLAQDDDDRSADIADNNAKANANDSANNTTNTTTSNSADRRADDATEAEERQRLIAAIDDIRSFLRRGGAGGAYLDEAKERRACQALLDYWASQCYSHQLDVPRTVLAPHDATLLPTLADDACTYVGLEAFDEADARHFFGRDEQVNALVERLKTQRLAVVTGASGCGKSSLVLAGVVPALKRGGVAGSQAWRYLPTLVPGFAPLQHLALALASTLLATASATERAAWADAQAAAMRQDPAQAARLLAEGDQPALVIVDQFEEALTLRTEQASPDYLAFVANLLALVENEAPAHRVILTMRKDVEPQLAREYPDLNRLYGPAAFPVYSMESTRLREAIEKPASQAGLKFQEGVVNDLIKSVVGEDASLPLLQFSLMALWERRKGNLVTHEAYRQVGSPRQAMADAASRLYETLSNEQKLAAQRVFIALSRPGEGGAVFRNRASRRMLHGLADPNNVDVVLRKFTEAHLLRVTPADTGAQDDLAEVTHESLLRNWDLLDKLFAQQRAEHERRAFLRKQAEKWREAAFDQAFLLSGLALQQANSEFNAEAITLLEGEFLAASNAAEQARQRALAEEEERRRAVDRARVEVAEERAQVARAAEAAAIKLAEHSANANRRTAVRLRVAMIALLLAAGLVIVAALAWYGAQRASEAAETRLLAFNAKALAETDAELSVLLAAEASAREPARTSQMAAVVVDASQFRRAVIELPAALIGEADALALDPTGTHLLIANGNGVTEWTLDAAGPKPSRKLSWATRPQDVNLLAYSPDGHTIAAATDLGAALWSGTGDLVAKQLSGSEPMQRVSFSANGHLLGAVSSDARTVSAWSVPEGEPLLSYKPEGAAGEGLIYSVVFAQGAAGAQGAAITPAESASAAQASASAGEATKLIVVKAPDPKTSKMRLFVHRVAGGHIDPRPTVDDMQPCPQFDFAYTAGGNKIGFSLNPKVCSFDVRNLGHGETASSVTPAARSGDVSDIAISPDGSLLIRLLSRTTEAQVLNLTTGELWRLQGAFDLPNSTSYEARLAVSGSGERLAIKGRNGAVRIFDLDKSGSGSATARWISPDDNLTVVPINDGRRTDLEFRNKATGKSLRLDPQGAYGDIRDFFVGADGRTLFALATPASDEKAEFMLAFDLPATGPPNTRRVDDVLAWDEDLFLARDGADWLLSVGPTLAPVYRMPAAKPETKPDAKPDTKPDAEPAPACGARPNASIQLGGPRLFAVQTCSAQGTQIQVFAIDERGAASEKRLLRTIERQSAEPIDIAFRGKRILLLKDGKRTEVWDLKARGDQPAFALEGVQMRHIYLGNDSSLVVSRRQGQPWELRDLAARGAVQDTLPAEFQIGAEAVYAWAPRETGQGSGILVRALADRGAAPLFIEGADARPEFSRKGDILIVKLPRDNRTRIYKLPGTTPIFETDMASFEGARVTDSGNHIRYPDGRLVATNRGDLIKNARARIHRDINDSDRCRALDDERACARRQEAAIKEASVRMEAAGASKSR